MALIGVLLGTELGLCLVVQPEINALTNVTQRHMVKGTAFMTDWLHDWLP